LIEGGIEMPTPWQTMLLLIWISAIAAGALIGDRSRDLVSDRRLPSREAMEQPPQLRHLTKPEKDTTGLPGNRRAGNHEKGSAYRNVRVLLKNC
jgi:hypothetical protein